MWTQWPGSGGNLLLGGQIFVVFEFYHIYVLLFKLKYLAYLTRSVDVTSDILLHPV